MSTGVGGGEESASISGERGREGQCKTRKGGRSRSDLIPWGKRELNSDATLQYDDLDGKGGVLCRGRGKKERKQFIGGEKTDEKQFVSLFLSRKGVTSASEMVMSQEEKKKEKKGGRGSGGVSGKRRSREEEEVGMCLR